MDSHCPRTHRPRPGPFRPYLEQLEALTLPATLTWTCGSGDWATASCWSLARLPGPDDDAVIDRPGDVTVTHSAGTNTVTRLTSRNPFVLSGGTLRLNGASSLDSSFLLSDGTLAGAGDVIVRGPFTWTGGSMNALGTTGKTLAYGDLFLSGPGMKRLESRTLETHRQTNWTGGLLDLRERSTILNTVYGLFIADGSAGPVGMSGLGTAPQFINRGHLRSRGDVAVRGTIAFSNHDRLTVDTGALQFHCASVGGIGRYFAAANTLLALEGATTTLPAETFIIGDGSLRISADQATVHSYIQMGGNILLGPGLINVFSRTFEARGLLLAARNSLVNIQGTTATVHEVYVEPQGSLTLNNAGLLARDGHFITEGVVTVNAGSWLHAVGAYLQFGGRTTLNSGFIDPGLEFLLVGGVLTGQGTIDATLVNAAEVRVGGPQTTGTLTVRGHYAQVGTALLNLKLGGAGAGMYDHLAVGEYLFLDGTLSVSLVNNFQPAAGNSFTLVLAAQRYGEFATVNVPPAGGGVRLNPAYDPFSVLLVSSATGPGPGWSGDGKRAAEEHTAPPTPVQRAAVDAVFEQRTVQEETARDLSVRPQRSEAWRWDAAAERETWFAPIR